MFFIPRRKLEMPRARPGAEGGGRRRCRSGTGTMSTANPIAPPFPDGMETPDRRHGLFLGRGARSSGRYRASTRPLWATPRAKRPIRPTRRCAAAMTGHNEVVLAVYDPTLVAARRDAEAVLGESRPDPGHAPGQRCRHPVPLGYLLHDRRRRDRSPKRRRPCSRSDFPPPATGGSPPRSSKRRTSTTPRITTSSIWPRSPAAIAASAARAVTCPAGVAVAAE